MTVEELEIELKKVKNRNAEVRILIGEEGEDQIDAGIFVVEDDDNIINLVCTEEI